MAHAQRLGQLCRYCRGLLPHSRRSLLRGTTSARFFTSESVNTSEPLPPPAPDGAVKSYPEKLQSLVRDISQLTLLETAQLNELLKSTLNIPDAPVMTMGAMPATSPVQDEEKQEEEQTSFTVNLVKYAADSKIKLIKEIKTLVEGMNLVQSKKFVESVPQVVQRDVSKEEAERLKSLLEAAGGVVELD